MEKFKVSLDELVVLAMGITVIFLSVPLNWPVLITAILVIWIMLMYYTLKNAEVRAAYLVYLIAFFTFLIGREVLERYGLHTITLVFSESINHHAELCILLALISTFVAYLISSKFKTKSTNKTINYNSDTYRVVRTVSKYFFYITYSFTLLTVLDVVRFVFKNGYYAYYTSYVSGLPYVLIKAGDIAPISLWVFLATMPSKKSVKLPVALYVIYLIVSLGTGRRFGFVSGLLSILVYFIIRNNINSAGEVWFGKKEKIAAIAIAPAIIVLMFIINIVRFQNEIDSIKILDSLTEFFYSQGVSINIIKRAQLYSLSLPKGKIYTIGSTLNLIQRNLFSRLLGAKYYSGNTIAHALYGNSLAHSLSYLVLGRRYLNGAGLGSCYIAEAYHDFGYLGVVGTSAIYGILLNKMFSFKSKNIWMTAISFLMLNALLHAGKGSFDSFFTDLLDMTTWGTFLLIFLVSKHFLTKERALQRRKDALL